MFLLEKDTSFLWYEQSHKSFDSNKKALTSTPLFTPPYYSRYFFVYMATSQEMVDMVPVQEDDKIHEHMIYYLSKNLIDEELWYTHDDMLALVTIHVDAWLRHYILLLQTMFIAHINPFQFILTKQMIGGNIINGL